MMETNTAPRVRTRHGYAGVFVLLSLVYLVGCDSGSSSDAAATSEPPTPDDDLPPLASTVVSLDAGQSIGVAHWPDSDTSAGGLGQPVDGLECVYPSPTTYHVHAHLSIFLNGEALTVPQHVGIVELSPTTECHYPLHTHNQTGMIHVHADAPTTFTLGQFFDIWGHPLQRDDLAGLMSLPVEVYITDDDVVTVYDGEIRDIELVSHREITFQIGTPITAIPQYTWSGD